MVFVPKRVIAFFADGSHEICDYCETISSDVTKLYKFLCRDFEIHLEDRDGIITVVKAVSRLKLFSPYESLIIDLEIDENVSRVLVLTLNTAVAEELGKGFGYYNYLAIDREPRVERPSDAIPYPSLSKINLSYVDHVPRVPCWTYPLVLRNINEVPKYSVFMLLDAVRKYVALMTLSSRATAYIGPGSRITIFSGKASYEIGMTHLLTCSVDNNPYKVIEDCVHKAAKVSGFKSRKLKKKPIFMQGLGWCSWNALLTEDLSHSNIVNIVKGLREKGVPIKWVIVDDGWQIASPPRSHHWFSKVIERLEVNSSRFPYGFQQLVKELKSLGIEFVGLWSTINMYWGGASKRFIDELGVEGYRYPPFDSYVPPPDIASAYSFYNKFLSWIKDLGFSFLKIDNQWIIHLLYQGIKYVGEASREIEHGLQLAAEVNNLDILNCMSMTPENYSNFLVSNVMRTSIDHIPFWKADAKLHILFNTYNSLLFNYIVYPDYDMWITYDPHSKIHTVSRVFSGGPIYITDRHPEKTDVELLKRIVLPDGEVVRVDEPALPTKDVLFSDPYNENVLLKIASRCRGFPVVAVFNISKEGVTITDNLSLKHLPFNIESGLYAYYSVFAGKRGTIDTSDDLEITLDELDADVYVFSRVIDGNAVIGLKEYILPPYPMTTYRVKEKRISAEFRVRGTVIALINGLFNEVPTQDTIIEL
ncbi:MAG: Sip1-related alpha-galactosidase [Ignisphaera sp.]|uniref:Raffinose synthase n=3 Tax=Ignisphaera aggregans TaxID=334771 RepID=A0A7J3MWN0_9CREN